ncbi:type IV pilus assembly protein PilM [Candidatus Parcubacteria bacterium]|nr:MAG: type IV pilus assembly protein PilM [Candidatus Parcubacteria bacterium]
MEFSFNGLFKNLKSLVNAKRSFLGVDIGSSTVKIVQIRKEEERAILETYGEIALGPYGNMKIGQSVKLPVDTMAQVIKDVMKEANAKANAARVSIPLKSSFVKMINLPINQEKNIADIVTLEARRHIPVPISEVTLDWWVLPTPEKEDKKKQEKASVEVLLVAIHNDVIAEYKNIMATAGLSASGFEIETFSLIRSGIGRGSQTIAILDIGATTSKMIIVDFGVLKSSILISKGSQDLTMALSQSLGVDFSKAEEVKREIGLSDLPEHQEISSVIEPVLDYIFHEAAIFLRDFQNKYGRTAGKLIISGGGSLLNGLSAYAVKKLTIEVERSDPFSKTEHPAFLSGVLKGVGTNFSVATGLALGEM